MKPITVQDLTALAPFYSCLAEPLADLNAMMMVAWREPLQLHARHRNGILSVFARWDDRLVLWGPPLGRCVSMRDILDALIELDDLNDEEGAGRILYLWERYPLWEEIEADSSLIVDAQASEYVYHTGQTASLRGRGLSSKRKAARRFTTDHRPRTLPYDASLADSCLAVINTWSRQRLPSVRSEFREKAELELTVCRSAFMDCLPMEGVVVMCNDRAVAFSVGASHAGQVFNCMFEKADRSFAGVSDFVFSELARHCLDRFPEINAGEDWGVDYLRAVKRSWRPLREQRSYTIRRRLA